MSTPRQLCLFGLAQEIGPISTDGDPPQGSSDEMTPAPPADRHTGILFCFRCGLPSSRASDAEFCPRCGTRRCVSCGDL